MTKRLSLSFLAALALGAAAWGQSYSFTPDILAPTTEETFSIGVGGEAGYSLDASLTHRILLDFSYGSEYFGFVAATSFRKDGLYSPDIANFPDGTLFGSYFFMDQGAMVLRGLGMELQVGRLDHHDVIDSPYSLFISSKRNPAVLANFRYENEFAFYETRWIELNARSSVVTPAFPGVFPDRGAQLKTYGVKLGDMRFGFQDAAVYTGRSFDLEYFVSPMPNYLIQYVKGTNGRPWSTGENENDIIGFFWDWQASDALYLNAQVFIDDLNVGGLGGTPLNPWKAAYSLGARLATPYGRFGLHHALATKYAFSTTADAPETAYPWAYYPDTRFPMADGTLKAVPFETLMIGYYNGENNIAVRLDYDHELAGFGLAGNLEFVLSGDKSPCNAWHAGDYKAGTKLLDSERLEKKLVLDAQVSRRLGDFLLFSSLRAGVALNALTLQAPYPAGTSGTSTIDEHAWIWRAGEKTEYLFSISLGLRYDIPVMKALRP